MDSFALGVLIQKSLAFLTPWAEPQACARQRQVQGPEVPAVHQPLISVSPAPCLPPATHNHILLLPPQTRCHIQGGQRAVEGMEEGIVKPFTKPSFDCSVFTHTPFAHVSYTVSASSVYLYLFIFLKFNVRIN